MIHAPEPLETFIGQSKLVEELRSRIGRVANSTVPVLIVGETGTGKEVCAKAIADLSSRRPFCPVNCAAIAESLVDSELFGHARGAFTGAVKDHLGMIGSADGGILFLDELADLPLPTQAKLLRTLESGEYRPVGSAQTRQASFRILASVSGDPEELTRAGRLRLDLLHRLGAVRFYLPPLRQRREDIPLLVNEFSRRFTAQAGREPVSVAPDAERLLVAHDWPGNVRQLRHVIEAALAIADGGEVTLGHIQDVIPPIESQQRHTPPTRTLAEARRIAEEDAIRDALAAANGNREVAAHLLGISEATLYRRLSRGPASEPGRED